MSLAELLMALLILSIVITTSMAAFVERSRRQRQAREIIVVYQALANESAEVQFLGRLGTYKYYNMDQVVAQALAFYSKLAGVPRREIAA